MKTTAKFVAQVLFFGLSFSQLATADIIPIEEVWSPEGNYDPAIYAKVAVVQWAPPQAAQVGITVQQADDFKLGNLKQVEVFVREAASNGAVYVSLPEFSVVGYPDIPELPNEEDNFRNREDIAPYVEKIPGKTSDYLAALAKELGIYIQAGMAEVDSKTDNYHNSIVVVGPEGTVVASYRKQHLFQLEYNYAVPGTQNTVFETAFGKIGLIVCSDVYDSEVLNKYRSSGIQVLSLSTSWAQENSGWGYFSRAATRVNAYVFAANQNYFPDSGIINPDGSAQSHIRQSDGIAYGFVPRLTKP
jgi:predicted amidohydrolase